jgi:hypothetical protein
VFISHKLCKERIRKVCHDSGRNVFLVFINRGTKTVVLILTTRTLINLKKDPHQRHTTCSVTLEEIQQQCNRHKQVYTNDTGLQSVCIMSDKDVVVLTMANKLTSWHQNPKVHHHIHNRLPPGPILSHLNPFHTPSANLPKIHPDPILPF